MTEIIVPENQPIQTQPKIAVIGVGGAGGNAVNNMINSNKMDGVQFIVANTDAQALEKSKAYEKIQLGKEITKGLGAGSKPEVGKKSAEEASEEIKEKLQNLDMLFIAAGMGGGTGTGASPVIARTARDMGVLTVAVVTKPFQFEGRPKMRRAESGIEELAKNVDTLLVIPNQNLLLMSSAQKNLSADSAFKMVDEVLSSGIRSITDLMVTPGLINLDFADIKTGMQGMGKAMMGTGDAEEGEDGDTTAITAAKKALNNPLLENTDIKDAKTVIVNVTCGPNLPLAELDEAVNYISDQANEETNFMHGIRFDDSMDNAVRISIVATGIGDGKDYFEKQAEKVIEESSRLKKIPPHTGEKTVADAFTIKDTQKTEEEIVTLKTVKDDKLTEKNAAEENSKVINSMPNAREFFQSVSVKAPEQQTMAFMKPEVIPLKNNGNMFKSHNDAAAGNTEKTTPAEKKVANQSFTLDKIDNISVDPHDKPIELPDFFNNIPFFGNK